MTHDAARRAGWILLVGVLAISTAAPLVKLADAAPPLVIASWRTGLATLILGGWTLMHHRSVTVSRGVLVRMLLAGACLALHFALWIGSLRYTTVAASVVLVTLSPVVVALAGALGLGERLRGRGWVGIGLAVAGATLIGWPTTGPPVSASAPNPTLGNLMALGGAVMAAAYLFVGRTVQRSAPLPTAFYTAVVYGTAAVCLIATCLLTGQPLTGYPLPTIGALVALALGPQLIGHTALNAGLRALPASAVAVATLGEPVGATLLAWTLLGERPSPVTLIGGLIVLVGVALTLTGTDTRRPAPLDSA